MLDPELVVVDDEELLVELEIVFDVEPSNENSLKDKE